MLPALLVPSVRPKTALQGTPITGFIGHTQQLTVRRYLIDGGYDDSGTGVVWSSTNNAIATVSGAGLVTFVGGGSCTIAATASGTTTSAVVSSLSETTYLASNFTVLGLYSAGQSLTVDGSNYISALPDAFGIAPTLTPVDAQGPLLVGSNLATRYFQTDVNHALQTILSSRFDTSGAITILWVSNFSHNGDPQSTGNFGVSLGTDNAGVSFLGWDGSFLQNGSANGPMIGGIYQPGGTEMKGNRPTGGRMRLFSVGRSGTTGRFRSAPLADVTSSISSIASFSNRLRVGNGGGTYVTEPFRAVLILSGVFPSSDTTSWNALRTWATLAHGAKVPVDLTHSVAFEGDSISVVPIGSSWPEQMTNLPAWAAYEDLNYAVSGSIAEPAAVWSSIGNRTADVDAAHTAGAKVVSLRIGTNDIAPGVGLNRTGAQALADTWTWCDARRAAGYKVAVWTMLARQDVVNQGIFNTQRASYNTLMRAQWASHADALIDIAGQAAYSSDTSWTDTTRFQADGIHPTVFAAQEQAAFASPTMLALA